MRTVIGGGKSCKDYKPPKGQIWFDYNDEVEFFGECEDCPPFFQTQKAMDEWVNLFRDCSRKKCLRDARAHLKAWKESCKLDPTQTCKNGIKILEASFKLLCQKCERP